MDRFTDDVQAIIELEQDIYLCGDHRIDTTWLTDRLRELEYRYQSLLRLWPVVAGRGTRRPLDAGDKTIG